MVDTKRYRDWFEKGRQDLRSAQILKEHDGDLWVVTFHCQQAVEKYLKGFILLHTQTLMEGHNLYKLCKRCTEIDEDFIEVLKDCGFLSNYYIETRYPADEPLVVTSGEAEDAVLMAEKVMGLVDGKINNE